MKSKSLHFLGVISGKFNDNKKERLFVHSMFSKILFFFLIGMFSNTIQAFYTETRLTKSYVHRYVSITPLLHIKPAGIIITIITTMNLKLRE